MNILLASPWDLDSTGGVSLVVRTLGRHFRASGNQVVFVIPKHGGRVERSVVDGNKLFHVSMRQPVVESRGWRSLFAFLLFLPISCWRLARLLHREHIDIVNLHYFIDLWVYFLIIRLFLRFRLVVSVHGSDVLGASGHQSLRLLEKWIPQIDQIVFCSEGFRKQTISPTSPLYAKSKVILNGIDAEEVLSVQAPPSEREYVVCVAHLLEHKAQDVLLWAYHGLTQDFPHLELDLVGDGPFRPQLERLTAELGLSSRVQFHGDVPRSRALELIACARVFCLPSRREPFGLVVLEAMSLRTPVVATRVGGVPEIVRHGIDGLLVEPDSAQDLSRALRRVLTDANLRKTIIENGQRRVKESFTLGRFAADYETNLKNIVAGR